jgi:hypothetical protein
MFCSENEVKEILRDVIAGVDVEGDVFVAYRKVDDGKMQRVVTFVIPTKEGNEQLINAICKASLKHDREFRFVKSEINVEDTNFTIDYVFVEAVIQPKII